MIIIIFNHILYKVNDIVHIHIDLIINNNEIVFNKIILLFLNGNYHLYVQFVKVLSLPPLVVLNNICFFFFLLGGIKIHFAFRTT